MTGHDYVKHRVSTTEQENGCLLLRSDIPLSPVANKCITEPDWLGSAI